MNQDIEKRILRLQTEIEILSSIKKNLHKQDQDSLVSKNEISGSSKDILKDLDYKIIEYKCRGINTSSHESLKTSKNNSDKAVGPEIESSILEFDKEFDIDTFKLCCCKNIGKYNKSSLKSLYYNEKLRPKSAIEKQKQLKKDHKHKCKKPGTAPIRLRKTLKCMNRIMKRDSCKVSRANFHDPNYLDYDLISSDFHDRCCKYKKILDETINVTNDKLDDLQGQFDDSQANLEFLSNGREFLVKTLDVLKTKYFNLKDAYNNVCSENEKLKEENQKFLSNIPNFEKSCDEFHECQLLVLRLQDENLQLQKTICNVKDVKDKMFQVLKQHKCEMQSLYKENCILKYEINSERSNHLLYVTEFENKLLHLIAIEQSTKDDINMLRNIVNNLKVTKELKKYETTNLGKELCCMKIKCSTLKKYISYLKFEDELKMKTIETELSKYHNLLTQNEDILTIEKSGILKIIEDLSHMVCTHRERIEQLIGVNKKLGMLVASQNTLLTHKEEEISYAEEIIESAVQQTVNLNQMINTLEMSLSLSEFFSTSMMSIVTNKSNNENSCCKGIEFIQQDLITTRSNLEEEKQKLAIKDKIIEDQADTIRNLNYKSTQTRHDNSRFSLDAEKQKLAIKDNMENQGDTTGNLNNYKNTQTINDNYRFNFTRNKPILAIKDKTIQDQKNITNNLGNYNTVDDQLNHDTQSCINAQTRRDNSSFKGDIQKLMVNGIGDRENINSNLGNNSIINGQTNYSNQSSYNTETRHDNSCYEEKIQKLSIKNIEDQDNISNLENYIIVDGQSNRKIKLSCKSVTFKEIDAINQMKNKLLTEIKALESRRNNLVRDVIDIKSEKSISSINPMEINRKIDEQYKVLKQLEDEVANKQEEWAKQRSILYEEKMKAIEVARIATHKLLETMIDFQNQTIAQKKARDKVAEIISKKLSLYDCTDSDEVSIQTLFRARSYLSNDIYDIENIKFN